jgi:hypothetical protein
MHTLSAEKHSKRLKEQLRKRTSVLGSAEPRAEGEYVMPQACELSPHRLHRHLEHRFPVRRRGKSATLSKPKRSKDIGTKREIKRAILYDYTHKRKRSIRDNER